MTLSYKKQKNILIITFLIIPLAMLLTFSYYPALKLFQQSLSDWDGYSSTFNYVGFNNYMDVFKDPSIARSLLNTGAYLIFSIIMIFFALYISIILNGQKGSKSFCKLSIFAPYVMNGVAIALMFNFFYNFEASPVNTILRNAGLEKYAIKWLSENYFSNFSLAFIGVWKNIGFYMVIFLGALQSIPGDYYEAANLDGANLYQKIRYIVLPSISKVIELNLFLCINGSLQAFSEAFVITKGGPVGATNTIITKMLQIAFDFNNIGEASAMGVLLMIIIMLMVTLQKQILRSKGDNL